MHDSTIAQHFLNLTKEQKEKLRSRLVSAMFAASNCEHRATCIEIARLGLAIFHGSSWWDYRFAEGLREMGRLREAEPLLLHVHPRKFQLRHLVEISLGQLYHETAQLDQAEHWFRRATATAPDDTAPWIYLGGFLAWSQRFDEAVATLERGLTATGDVDEVWLNLSFNKRALGDYEAARTCLENAIALCPDYPAARVAIADIDWAIKVRSLMDSALGVWAHFLSIYFPEDAQPTDDPFPVLHSQSLTMNNAADLPGDFLTMTAEQRSELDAQLMNALSATIKEGNCTTEIEITRLAMAIHPDDSWWVYMFANALRQIGHFREAEDLLLQIQPVERRRPHNVETCLGRLYDDSARHEKAEQWFRKAVETAPDFAETWSDLGKFLITTERYAQAIEVLKRGLAEAGDDEYLWLNLGLANRSLEDYEAARKCFQMAISSSPDDDSPALVAMEDVDRAMQVRKMKSSNIATWESTLLTLIGN